MLLTRQAVNVTEIYKMCDLKLFTTPLMHSEVYWDTAPFILVDLC